MMICPRCDTEMLTESIEYYDDNKTKGTVTVEFCSACEGRWFDKGELELVSKIVKTVFFEKREIPEHDKYQRKAITCPKCNNFRVLQKIKNKQDRHVTMDICRDCNGVWLDKNELNAIQTSDLLSILISAAKFQL